MFTRTALSTLAIAGLCLAACSGPHEDQLRTVKSYEFASCDSTPTSDATELAALQAFRSEVVLPNFSRERDSLIAAAHEPTLEESGLRQYEGPVYLYLHPRKVEPQERAAGVDWAGMAYLHASKVRTRANGGEWQEWERVRTRNFAETAPSAGGLGRWKCLVGSEIAWAEVMHRNGEWIVAPAAISVYEADELQRLQPTPDRAQIDGTHAVAPL